MKIISPIVIMACLLYLTLSPVQARVSEEYIRWSKGEFEPPLEIRDAKNASELQPFLASKREFYRMSAVRRLSELEGSKAINLLLEVFAKEAPTEGLEAAPLVKLEVIRSLGRIGTEQAKSALLNILNNYWQRGPDVKDKRRFYLDRDFTHIMRAVLQTLDRWRHDPVVFKIVESIALSEDVKEFYTPPNEFGQVSWELYLKCKMIKEGITEEENSAIYLLRFMEDVPGVLRNNTLDYLKCWAARSVLEEHSKTTLSSLADEFEKELKEQELLDPEGALRECHIKLRNRISCLRAALKEKVRREKLSQK